MLGSASPEHHIISKNEQTYFTRTTQEGSFVDCLDLAEVNLTIGDEISYGISLGKNKKWLLGGAIHRKQLGRFLNNFCSNQQYQLPKQQSSCRRWNVYSQL